MRDFVIYCLKDPFTGFVRYIGKSSSGLKRARQHRTPHRLRGEMLYNPDKCRWVRALLELGLCYTVQILERVATVDALNEAEVWWIAHGRAVGWPLTNRTDGGGGLLGLTHSEEAREKISRAHKGRPKTAEHKAALSAAKKGRTLTPEHRAKLSEIHKRRIAANPAEQERLRTLRTGASNSPEARAKLRSANLGLKHSEERREKNRRAQTGRRQSAETKAKRSAALKAAHARRREQS